MASKFVITAELNLQTGNINQVVSSLKKQFAGANVNINVKQIAAANAQLSKTAKLANEANVGVGALSKGLVEATKKFTVLTLATGTFVGLARALKHSAAEAVKFQREMVKISQATGGTLASLSGLSNEISNVSKSFGVSSTELVTAARNLVQAGFAANKVKGTLDLLAKTELAATFDSIADTTEGVIAVLNQFGKAAQKNGTEIEFLEKSLSAINQVSKDFAVESSDLITAIRTTGSAFESAGGSLDELLALFTSVRATTRESAESISTGFRTIFTRVQRVDTINRLKDLGIELQDATGKFIGPVEAVKKLSAALNTIDPRDFRFNVIVEELGGFRQVSKVIPLIQQFSVAQQALNVAQKSSGSLAKDAASAQQSLAVQIAKVREEFDTLVRDVVNSDTFQYLSKGAISLASAIIKIGDSLRPLLPMLLTFGSLKLGQAIIPAVKYGIGQGKGLLGEAQKKHMGGTIQRFARGGVVPGTGDTDTVPAMLTPGEFVIRKSSVKKLGTSTLARMNENGYAKGGEVSLSDPIVQKTVASRTKIYGKKKTSSKRVPFEPDEIGLANDGRYADKVFVPEYDYKKININQDAGGRFIASIAGDSQTYPVSAKDVAILKKNTMYSTKVFEDIANLFYQGEVTSNNETADLINGNNPLYKGIGDGKFTLGKETISHAAAKGLGYVLSQTLPSWSPTAEKGNHWFLDTIVDVGAAGQNSLTVPSKLGSFKLTKNKQDRIPIPPFTFFGLGAVDNLSKTDLNALMKYDEGITTEENTLARTSKYKSYSADFKKEQVEKNIKNHAQHANSGGIILQQPANRIRHEEYTLGAFKNAIIKQYLSDERLKKDPNSKFETYENVWDAVFSTDDAQKSGPIRDYYLRSVNLGNIAYNTKTGESYAKPSKRGLEIASQLNPKGTKDQIATAASTLAVKAQQGNADWLEKAVHDIVGGQLVGSSYYMDIVGADATSKGLDIKGDVEVKDTEERYKPQQIAEKALSTAIDRFYRGVGPDPISSDRNALNELMYSSVTTQPNSMRNKTKSVKEAFRQQASNDKSITNDQILKAIAKRSNAIKSLPDLAIGMGTKPIAPSSAAKTEATASKTVENLVNQTNEEAQGNYATFLSELNVAGKKAPVKINGEWARGALGFLNKNGALHSDSITFLREFLGLGNDQIKFANGQAVAFPNLSTAQIDDLANRIGEKGLKLNKGGAVSYFANGGHAQGTDTVPAMLTPGEFVINKKSAQTIGYGKLNRMNKVGKYAQGGVVGLANGGKFDPAQQTNLKNAFIPTITPLIKQGQVEAISKMLDKFIAAGLDAEAAMEAIAREIETQKKKTGNFRTSKEFTSRVENAATQGGRLTEKEDKPIDYQKLAAIGMLATTLSANFSSLDNAIVKSIASFSALYPVTQGIVASFGKTIKEFGNGLDKKIPPLAAKFPNLGSKLESFGKGLSNASSYVAAFQAAAGAAQTVFENISQSRLKEIQNEFQDAAKGNGSRDAAAQSARSLSRSNTASKIAGAASSVTAMGGTAIGSVIGSIGGPFGRALGAAIGGSIGTVIDATVINPIKLFGDNIEQSTIAIFNSKKALYQFNKDLEKIGEKSLKSVTDMGVGTGGNVGNIQAQIDTVLRNNGGVAPTSGPEGELFQSLKDELAAASQAFNRVTGELNSRILKEMQKMASEFGKVDFAKTLKPVEDSIRASFAPMKASAQTANEVALANDKEQLAIIENRKTMKEAEVQILRQTAAARAEADARQALIGSIQKEKAYKDAAAKNNFRSEGNLNRIQKLNSGDFSSEVNIERLSKSLDLALSTPEKDAALRTLQNTLPGADKGDVQMFKDIQKISSGLETALSALPSTIGSDADRGKFFESYFGKQGVGKNSPAIAALTKFTDRIIKAQGDKDKGVTPGSLSDEVKEQIIKMFKGSEDVLRERLQSFLQALANFSKETAQIFEGVAASSQKLIDIQGEEVDSAMRFKEAMSHITGKDVPLGEKNAARDRKLALQTGGLTNPADISKQIIAATTEAKALQDAQEKTPIQDPKEIEMVNYRLKELGLIVGNSKKALQSLANQSDKTADILKQYDSLESKRKAFISSLESFTFGTQDERRNMARINATTQNVARTGNIDAVREEDRAGVSSLLDQFKDVAVFGGKTGEDVKKQLLANKASQLVRAGGGTEADVAKAVQTVMDKTDPQKQLVKDLENLAKSEAAARQGLVDQEKVAMASLVTALGQTRDAYNQRNSDIMSGKAAGENQNVFARDALKEQGIAPATKQTTETLLAAASEAQKAAVGFRNAAEILVNRTSQRQKDVGYEQYNNSRSYLNPYRQMSPDSAMGQFFGVRPAQYRAGGGSIFKPRGTDTVPAMLTPGEFVIKKSAVDAIGVDKLHAINGYAVGGEVEDEWSQRINARKSWQASQARQAEMYQQQYGNYKAATGPTDADMAQYRANVAMAQRVNMMKRVANAEKVSRQQQQPANAGAMATEQENSNRRLGIGYSFSPLSFLAGNGLWTQEQDRRQVLGGYKEGIQQGRQSNLYLGASTALNVTGVGAIASTGIDLASRYATNDLSASDIGWGALPYAGASARGAYGLSRTNAARNGLSRAGQFAMNNKASRFLGDNQAKRFIGDNKLTRGLGYGRDVARKVFTKYPTPKSSKFQYRNSFEDSMRSVTGQAPRGYTEFTNSAQLTGSSSDIARSMVGSGDAGFYRYATPRATGGPVDSVPAMLTPGEFVMSKRSVDKHGLGFMNHLNKGGGVKGFNRGGVVYKEGGGSVEATAGGTAGPVLNVELLNNIANQFAAFTNTLQNISSNLSGMSMSHTVTVDGQVNIAGFNSKAVADAIRTEVTNQVITEVKRLMGDQNNNAKNMRAT